MMRLSRVVVAGLAAISLALILFLVSAYLYNRFYVEYEYRMDAWAQKRSAGEAVEWPSDHSDPVRILAIRGGALFGIADAVVLQELERRSGKKIHELFDVVAGTSTGAIIAALLLLPEAETGQPMSAADVASSYERLGEKILSAPLAHTVLTGRGLIGPRFKNHARIIASERVFGENTFGDLVRPALFPGFSRKDSQLKVFRNWKQDHANLLLAPLVSAVTSAPTYFPSVRWSGEGDQEDFVSDAGLIVNDPAHIAYMYARSNVEEAKQFVVVSVGTRYDFSISESLSVRGGVVQWMSPLFLTILDGSTTVNDLYLSHHRKYDSDVEIRSFDLQTAIPPEVTSFDPSRSNMAAIRRSGQETVRKNAAEIEKIVAILTDSEKKDSRRQAQN